MVAAEKNAVAAVAAVVAVGPGDRQRLLAVEWLKKSMGCDLAGDYS